MAISVTKPVQTYSKEQLIQMGGAPSIYNPYAAEQAQAAREKAGLSTSRVPITDYEREQMNKPQFMPYAAGTQFHAGGTLWTWNGKEWNATGSSAMTTPTSDYSYIVSQKPAQVQNASYVQPTTQNASFLSSPYEPYIKQATQIYQQNPNNIRLFMGLSPTSKQIGILASNVLGGYKTQADYQKAQEQAGIERIAQSLYEKNVGGKGVVQRTYEGIWDVPTFTMATESLAGVGVGAGLGVAATVGQSALLGKGIVTGSKFAFGAKAAVAGGFGAYTVYNAHEFESSLSAAHLSNEAALGKRVQYYGGLVSGSAAAIPSFKAAQNIPALRYKPDLVLVPEQRAAIATLGVRGSIEKAYAGRSSFVSYFSDVRKGIGYKPEQVGFDVHIGEKGTGFAKVTRQSLPSGTPTSEKLPVRLGEQSYTNIGNLQRSYEKIFIGRQGKIIPVRLTTISKSVIEGMPEVKTMTLLHGDEPLDVMATVKASRVGSVQFAEITGSTGKKIWNKIKPPDTTIRPVTPSLELGGTPKMKIPTQASKQIIDVHDITLHEPSGASANVITGKATSRPLFTGEYSIGEKPAGKPITELFTGRQTHIEQLPRPSLASVDVVKTALGEPARIEMKASTVAITQSRNTIIEQQKSRSATKALSTIKQQGATTDISSFKRTTLAPKTIPSTISIPTTRQTLRLRQNLIEQPETLREQITRQEYGRTPTSPIPTVFGEPFGGSAGFPGLPHGDTLNWPYNPSTIIKGARSKRSKKKLNYSLQPDIISKGRSIALFGKATPITRADVKKYGINIGIRVPTRELVRARLVR